MIKRTFSTVAVLLSKSSKAVQSRCMEPSLKGHSLPPEFQAWEAGGVRAQFDFLV